MGVGSRCPGRSGDVAVLAAVADEGLAGAGPAAGGMVGDPAGERRAAACAVLGWLSFFRSTALAEGAKHAELAKALTCLAPLAGDPAVPGYP